MGRMNVSSAIRKITKLSVYGAVALPLAIAGLAGARGVGRWHRWLLDLPADATPSVERVRRFSGKSLIASLATFAVLAPVWAVFVARGFLYPLVGADNLETSWGGPSLAGAWLAHWIQGPPLLLVVTLLTTPITRYQRRLAVRYLGA